MEKSFLIYRANNIPTIKNIKTETTVPCPLPNKDPKYINKKIIDEETILNLIPIIKPIIKKNIINNKFPRPIPKYEPTYAI